MRILVPLLLLPLAIVALFIHTMSAQQNQTPPELNKIIEDVQRAESSGANVGEINNLLAQLNYAIELQDQLQNLSPQDSNKRAQILGQLNDTLSRVDAEANQLTITASQNTSTYHLIAYSSGAVGAVIGTAAYELCRLIRRRFRIKRMFQMKITLSR